MEEISNVQYEIRELIDSSECRQRMKELVNQYHEKKIKTL